MKSINQGKPRPLHGHNTAIYELKRVPDPSSHRPDKQSSAEAITRGVEQSVETTRKECGISVFQFLNTLIDDSTIITELHTIFLVTLYFQVPISYISIYYILICQLYVNVQKNIGQSARINVINCDTDRNSKIILQISLQMHCFPHYY